MHEYVMSKNYISNLYLNGVFEICQEVFFDWPSLKQQELNVNLTVLFFYIDTCIHAHNFIYYYLFSG